MRLVLIALVGLAVCGAVTADTWIEKLPDYGPWWWPIGNGGTYLYADSFTMPDTPDVIPATLGTWLLYGGGATPSVVSFEIWGDKGGLPDWDNILAGTDLMSTDVTSLEYYELPAIYASPLVPGEVYYFVINAWDKGDPSNGSYQTGGHTQGENPGYFYYSNYPENREWDGQRLTPEMAFKVGLIVPEPTAVAPLAALLLGGLAYLRRR